MDCCVFHHVSKDSFEREVSFHFQTCNVCLVLIRKQNTDFKEDDFLAGIVALFHLLRSCGSSNRCEEDKLLRVADLGSSGWTITGKLAKRVTIPTVGSIPAPPFHYSADPAWGLNPDAYQHACPTTWPRHMVAWQGAKVESLKRNCAKAAQASADAAAWGRTRQRIQFNLDRALEVENKHSNDINTSAIRNRTSAFKKQMSFLLWGSISESKFWCLWVANICFRVCCGLVQEKVQIKRLWSVAHVCWLEF